MNSSSSIIFQPVLLPRFWLTLFWALILSVGVGFWNWSEWRLAEMASPQTIILLPKATLDETERRQIQHQIEAEPGLARAHWVSPSDLTRQVARRFPQEEWQTLFPADAAWMPWLLEVQPSDPLNQEALLRAFAARQKQAGTWRLILLGSPTVANADRTAVGGAPRVGLLAAAGRLERRRRPVAAAMAGTRRSNPAGMERGGRLGRAGGGLGRRPAGRTAGGSGRAKPDSGPCRRLPACHAGLIRAKTAKKKSFIPCHQ